MDVITRIRSLCTPAFVFFFISVISLFLMIFENIQNTHSYCFGNVSCNVANTSMVFIVKIVFIIAWTWFLDILCSRGYERLVVYRSSSVYHAIFCIDVRRNRNQEYEQIERGQCRNPASRQQ